MSRIDDRPPSALRPVQIIVESLHRVDGSASFAFGRTKALASVSGPIQVRLAAELPSRASFEVLVRPLSGVPGTESRSIATTLRTLLLPSLVLTQNPRTLIQLVVQSLTPTSPIPNPSLTAASINASSLALLRASSFPMLGVICAAAVGRVKEHDIDPTNKFLLNPSEEELQECDAVGCVAVMFKAPAPASRKQTAEEMEIKDTVGEIVWSSFHGPPLQADYDALLRLAKTGALSVYHVIRGHLEEESQGKVLETTDQLVKKMPKHKGGRVALNVDTGDLMDTA